MTAARPLLALALLWLLTACSPPPFTQQQAYVFGTLVEVGVYGAPEAGAHKATAAVLAHFDALHRQLHAWQPSELSALNTAFAAGERATVTPDSPRCCATHKRSRRNRTNCSTRRSAG
jgi:thiamine biosynthesis lipoprotein